MQSKRYNILIILVSTVILLVSHANLVNAQVRLYRVFLKDKGVADFSKGKPIYEETLALHSKKSLERRRKYLPTETLISIEDAPIHKDYIEQIESLGGLIRHKLRWLNYLVVECTEDQKESIEKLKFIKEIQSSLVKPDLSGIKDKRMDDLFDWLFVDGINIEDYGYSSYQIELLNVKPLHDLGIIGDGVLVGFLDTGFDLTNHEALINCRIYDRYDFINNDFDVSMGPNDHPDFAIHGTTVFSTVAAFKKDSLIGIAPGAEFALASTEDLFTETRAEEDNLAAAIEWLELMGADIASMSIGYRNLDLGLNYEPSDLNGSSTISARYINEATRRGMLCVAAAGNNGKDPESLITPGDADSSLTVGGYDWDGINFAGFSSYGTIKNNNTKPDIAAQAVAVYGVEPFTENKYKSYKGTSYATPLIAGCATLLLAAHPDKTPFQVRDALYMSGTFSQKDSRLGFGMPDAYKAVIYSDILIRNIKYKQYEDFLEISCYCDSFYDLKNVEGTIIPLNGSDLVQVQLEKFENNEFKGFLPIDMFQDSLNTFYLIANDANRSRRAPIALDSTFPMFVKLPITDTLSSIEEFVELDIKLIKNILQFNEPLELQIISSTYGKFSINILDAIGNNLDDNSQYNNSIVQYSIGTSYLKFDSKYLANGVYFLKFTDRKNTIIEKFLVAR